MSIDHRLVQIQTKDAKLLIEVLRDYLDRVYNYAYPFAEVNNIVGVHDRIVGEYNYAVKPRKPRQTKKGLGL
jgi:hypothetical protein